LNNGIAFDIEESPPDVAIIDIDDPFDSGMILARKMKQRLPSIGIAMLTYNPSDDQLLQALKARASAYLSKEVNTDHLVNVIKRVAAGEHPINESLTTNPNLANQLLQQFQEISWQGENEDLISPLTQRETEILNLIAKGYLNRQIAVKIGTSEQIIKSHVTSIMRKLNTNVSTEAVVVAVRKGLISID
jgi:two-component system response regulator DegU